MRIARILGWAEKTFFFNRCSNRTHISKERTHMSQTTDFTVSHLIFSRGRAHLVVQTMDYMQKPTKEL